MTDSLMHLRTLVEKTPDADILRKMISFAAVRLMKMEVGGLTGVSHGGKSVDRLVQRNPVLAYWCWHPFQRWLN
jgi:putative transposase